MEARVSGPLGESGIERVTVVMPSWVGDSVMATPVLRAMREHLPNVHLTALVRPGLDELLAGAPWCDGVVSAPFKGVGGFVRTVQTLRAAMPDAVLLLPNSPRSAMIARLSGARRRIGYDRDGRGWLLTDRVPMKHDKKTPISAVTYYAELAEAALGMSECDRRLELGVTDAQREAGAELLDEVPRPFVLINPGANRTDKRWPAEQFAAAASRLREQYGTATVVTGSPGEAELVADVVAQCDGPTVDLVSRGVTLGSLKAVAAEASVLVTNDTGPRHIAAAMGTPVVALFGPTDARWTQLPGAIEHVLRAEPFLPVELVADEYPKACAIDRITVGDVVAATGRVMRARHG